MKTKNPVWISVRCVRCGCDFDTIETRKSPNVCIECYQCCVPANCAECGKTFGAVDPNKHRHVRLDGAVCTDCIYRRNLARLGS